MSDDPEQDGADDEIDYENRIGYGQPPKKTRWRKGQRSPNPNGRPRKNTSRKHFLEKAANRAINLIIGRKTKQVSTLEAIVHHVKAKAISGNTQALSIYAMLIGVAAYNEEEYVELALFPLHEELTTDEWLEMYEREMSRAEKLRAPPSDP